MYPQVSFSSFQTFIGVLGGGSVPTGVYSSQVQPQTARGTPFTDCSLAPGPVGRGTTRTGGRGSVGAGTDHEKTPKDQQIRLLSVFSLVDSKVLFGLVGAMGDELDVPDPLLRLCPGEQILNTS